MHRFCAQRQAEELIYARGQGLGQVQNMEAGHFHAFRMVHHGNDLGEHSDFDDERKFSLFKSLPTLASLVVPQPKRDVPSSAALLQHGTHVSVHCRGDSKDFSLWRASKSCRVCSG